MEFSISGKDDTGDILDDELLDDDLLEDELQIEEYESTDTISDDLLEPTDPEIDIGFDVKGLEPDEVGFDDVDEGEADDLLDEEIDDVDDIIDEAEDDDEDDDEIIEDDEDEYELDEEVGEVQQTVSIKDKVLGFIEKFKKPKDKKSKTEPKEDDDEDLDEDLDDLDDEGTASFTARLDSTVKTALHKLPALAKLLNKNNDEVKAVDVDGNELDDLELEEEIPGKRKKFKLTPIQIIAVVLAIVFFLFIDEEDTSQVPPVAKAPIQKAKSPEEIIRENNAKKQAEAKAVETPAKEVTDEEPPAEVTEEEPPAEVTDEVPPADTDSSEPAEVANEDTKDENSEEQPDMTDTPVADEKTTDEAQESSETPKDKVAQELKKIDENAKVDLEDLKAENQPKTEETTVAEPVAENTEQPIPEEPKTVENIADSDLDEIDLTQVQTTPSEQPDENPDMGDSSEDNSAGEVNNNPVAEARPEEIIPQKEMQPDISTDITRKLLADLEVRLKEEKTVQKTLIVTKPTSAPTYELVGDGLVYNCKDKHWACIDQTQYKKCRGNFSWNKSEGVPVECYPVALLETAYDCAIIQQEKIDSVSDTDFCAE